MSVNATDRLERVIFDINTGSFDSIMLGVFGYKLIDGRYQINNADHSGLNSHISTERRVSE
jgi:hypothetical protein